MIIKPIIISDKSDGGGGDKPKPQKDIILIEDDCDELGVGSRIDPSSFNQAGGSFPRMKQLEDGSRAIKIQRKFYRKVVVGDKVYSRDTFTQGLNVIVIRRDGAYTKLYERTFNTNNSVKESEEMAKILQEASCGNIIVITGIGKWMGAMTPSLIMQIKQIGGPNLNNLYSADANDNTMADHAFILVGRRGLCRYNGAFRIKNFDISKEMSSLFPDKSSDPNECFFENVQLDNEKNEATEKQFFHIVDMRFTLNLNNDNRFAYNAPSVATVSPFKGSILGGQEIKISGFNFGMQTTDVKEILVGGVVCGDFILLGPNLLSCVTRASTILGPGPGNVVVRLQNYFESPIHTCNVFEYVGEHSEALANLNQTILTAHKMRDIPIYVNANYNDQDISLFDHLVFNESYYKRKLRPDYSNKMTERIDSMVHDNYKGIIGMINSPNAVIPGEGIKRRRFRAVTSNLAITQ